MDNLPASQFQQPSPEPQVLIVRRSFFQTLLGKAVIIFSAVALLLIIILVLNYFNMLPISQNVPQLKFLPQKASLTRERVKNDTQNLINDVILTSLIPSNLVFEKQNVKNPNNYTFYGTGWTGKQGETFVITIEYNQRKEVIDRQIRVHIPIVIENLDIPNTVILLGAYFSLKPPSPFICTELPMKDSKTILCESFWQDQEGIKKGINVISPVKGFNETQLFYCEHHKGNPAYDWKSCDILFKDRGVVQK